MGIWKGMITLERHDNSLERHDNSLESPGSPPVTGLCDGTFLAQHKGLEGSVCVTLSLLALKCVRDYLTENREED